MQEVEVRFSARRVGAIGTWQVFTVKLFMDNPTDDKVRLACYDAGYEHISGLNWRIVFENTQKKPA